ncbi:MAG TPA: DUF1456 family protein [Saprospiraceae bacterium]|nr:DUF1456 family protein [Saprospiraceae bacterium]
MNSNDILRRLRYTFDFDDDKMIKLFAMADYEVTRTEVCNWLKREDDPDFQKLHDKKFATFLNGFINYKRGKRDGPQPIPEKRLTNNMILRKLKIALNLKDTDMIEILNLVDMRVSKHELSAFFRKPSQSQYRECHDQILRNFLQGLQIKFKSK